MTQGTERFMRRRVAAVALAASLLVTGCAWRSTGGPPPGMHDLIGTWHGDIGQPGGSLYAVEAQAALEIKPDGTFSAIVTPARGSNNLARRSSWSGVVVGDGDRVTFQSAQGPSLTLVRSRDHLYGVASDPLTAMGVMIDFERSAGDRRTVGRR